MTDNARAGEVVTQDDGGLVRDILVALCERDGLSLDSDADPGTPARNYELGLRLGIGEVFGLPQPAKSVLCREGNPETGDICQCERGHTTRHAAWADPSQPPTRTWS